jgi:WD40 repeat protein
MEIDVLDAGHGRFVVALVYSNSTVRVFLYTSAEARFDLLLRGRYSSNSLTEVHFLNINDTKFLVTGTTDGYLAFWPLPKSIEWSIHHSVHTSSIKSLVSHKLSPTHQLPVGGGDDSALSITTLTFDQEDPSHQHGLGAECTRIGHHSHQDCARFFFARSGLHRVVWE